MRNCLLVRENTYFEIDLMKLLSDAQIAEIDAANQSGAATPATPIASTAVASPNLARAATKFQLQQQPLLPAQGQKMTRAESQARNIINQFVESRIMYVIGQRWDLFGICDATSFYYYDTISL
jgi:hypothetical protein